MLQLKNIKKDYPAGNGVVHALKGIDLQFRKSEFVSILGPSGCGKTTMLNIIGGLDAYTEGDLVINGRSTKDFKDRDWDAYRNHSVGFVFQSYNLIPHQSVLQNVELALTLSGVSKSERRRRAREALEQVGLGDQLKKKPGEMSGGQMQRVAIARALVNNPDIILADEPTGALDTETSVQVMEILKEVAKERLVVMVTHNPDLAETYSTRIIRMLDGVITDDSAPFAEEIEPPAKVKGKKERKPSMSFATAFGLSLKNLFTKKGRTALTSFAGSIGIIGIALILSVSQGMTRYIDVLQEDTLSSYPLTLESQHMDAGTLLQTFMGTAESAEEHENDAIYQKSVVYELINALNELEADENDLKSFKAFLESKIGDNETYAAFNEALNGVSYSYDLDLLVYTENVDGHIVRSDSEELLQNLMAEYMGMNMANMENAAASSPMSMFMPGNMSMGLWQEMLSAKDGALINPLLEKQYDVIHGRWPAAYNEIVLVVDENNELDDMTLYALGLKSEEEIDAIMDAALNKTPLDVSQKKWSYEEVCGRTFRVVLNADCYSYDEKSGTYTDLRETETGLKYVYGKGLDLKVVGILRPNEDAVSAMLTGSIGYTTALTEYVIEKADGSAAIKAQLDDPHTDIFTGLPFKETSGQLTDKEKETEFRAYVKGLSTKEKAAAYVDIMSIPSQEQLDAGVKQALRGKTREDMEETLAQILKQQMSVDEKDLETYLSSMSDEDMTAMFTDLLEEQIKMQYAAGVQAQMAALTTEQLAGALTAAMPHYTAAQCAVYYEELLEFSDSTYEDNLLELGYLDLDTPSAINLYATTFEGKDVLEEVIAEYNDSVDELSRISYTDYIGLMMSSITTIINAITYVLIAFVAISLVVSSIMIGVITLISVQERTKEIGILRAIGASKRNVSSMFNAETVIIGFTSGLLGVVITYLLCIPINAILYALTDIANLRAYLPIEAAVVLVAISVGLTLISGIIPSRSAAKKDPVVALRTE
ncbi:MAG: ABC transporter ATP-binding protein/permease [Clostridia bacterium]|nr:ABC transporter ATP-binding protein/permease [Clostridia bacterium]